MKGYRKTFKKTIFTITLLILKNKKKWKKQELK